jgi:hypothetical protein
MKISDLCKTLDSLFLAGINRSIDHGVEIVTGKSLRFAARLGTVISVVLLAQTLAAESAWFTIDGGGDLSSGGNYTVAGTIGQPDADVSSGGEYELTGGFWSGAYQGARPTLTITLSNGNAILHWPSWATGWVPLMKQTLSAGTAWTRVSQPVVLSGEEFTVTIPANMTAAFYQLWLP